MRASLEAEAGTSGHGFHDQHLVVRRRHGVGGHVASTASTSWCAGVMECYRSSIDTL